MKGVLPRFIIDLSAIRSVLAKTQPPRSPLPSQSSGLATPLLLSSLNYPYSLFYRRGAGFLTITFD